MSSLNIMSRFSRRPSLRLSRFSSFAVPDSHWFASDFLLGAGMVVIQPTTGKVVVVNDTESGSWFLPKGRKDIGESLEQAALREAYEESGYRVSFLPLITYSRAPLPPNVRPESRALPNTEAIYVTTHYWGPKKNRRGQFIDDGGEYISYYFVGQIPVDAVREENTGMEDEKNYISYLLPVEEAIQKLTPSFEASIVYRAWDMWQYTVEVQDRRRANTGGDISDH